MIPLEDHHITDYVLTGLVKRRATLTGEIEAIYERLKRLLADLESIDATILQFDPTHRVEAIRPRALRPPKDWSNRGQMSRIVLSILRQAAEPMTSRDIALELLVARALDKRDRKLLGLMTKRVGWRSGPSGRTAPFSLSRGRGSSCCGR